MAIEDVLLLVFNRDKNTHKMSSFHSERYGVRLQCVHRMRNKSPSSHPQRPKLYICVFLELCFDISHKTPCCFAGWRVSVGFSPIACQSLAPLMGSPPPSVTHTPGRGPASSRFVTSGRQPRGVSEGKTPSTVYTFVSSYIVVLSLRSFVKWSLFSSYSFLFLFSLLSFPWVIFFFVLFARLRLPFCKYPV